ncbi:TPA: hypothetical protein DCZ39_03005 [Patescibacteria group bacterium]|nr:hypothetical protein [Candidatus Gracilibacteria bacterium]
MEKRIDSMKIVIATKQRIIDSLSISSNYYYTKKISKPQSYGSITYQHQDKITTEILKALSGFDTDALYPDTAKEIVGEQDSVMYKTLWMMNTKYKNPKIGLVEKFDEETTRADYDYRSNTI